MGLLEIVELPPYMCPASCFPYVATFVDLLEPGVTIGLQCSPELAQVRFRMFSLAIWGVGEPYRCWSFVSRRPIVPHIPRLVFSIPRRQHRYRRVVRVQLLCRQHLTS